MFPTHTLLFVILVLHNDISTALRQRVKVVESKFNLYASATELPINLIFDFDFDASVMMQMTKDTVPRWREGTVEEASGNDGGDDDGTLNVKVARIEGPSVDETQQPALPSEPASQQSAASDRSEPLSWRDPTWRGRVAQDGVPQQVAHGDASVETEYNKLTPMDVKYIDSLDNLDKAKEALKHWVREYKTVEALAGRRHLVITSLSRDLEICTAQLAEFRERLHEFDPPESGDDDAQAELQAPNLFCEPPEVNPDS